jgi:hypothetical protein
MPTLVLLWGEILFATNGGPDVRLGNHAIAGALSGTLGDDRSDKSENRSAASKIGEINEGDLYVPASAANSKEDSRACHFKDVCEQMLVDHADRPKTRVILQVVARVLGLTFARCLSNVIAYVSGRAWLDARRDYAVLPPNAVIVNSKGEPVKIEGVEMTAKLLAERFKPEMCTISEDQSIDENLRATEIRYEVLPPRQSKNHYALLYYIRRESEHLPIPILGLLLDWIRPLLYATKSEWNAIEVNIDRETGEPISMNYESSNYTGDPLSFEITSNNDVHLPAKVLLRDKKWVHTLHQKDNRAKTHEIENPFEKGTHPRFAFVNWNGALDLVGSTRLLGYDTEDKTTNKKTLLYPMKELPLTFLDIDTYRKQALDLRNQWLKRRQTGHCYLYFPPRKDPKSFKVVNLVSEQLPSLIAR